ncbi:MAG: M20 family metallopeptidase [Nitrospinota bacterium]|nr:M20 family metallopeptidase [Nitrospinota bacterium]
MTAQIKQEVIDYIDSISKEIWDLSIELHKNPELSLKEHNSSEILCNYLLKHGFKVQRGLANLPTAFLAENKSIKKRKIGFVSEYDALPELGHACGHNIIAMASIAAGVSINKIFGGKFCQIKIFGTPGEESGGGKVLIAKGGHFDGIDAIMMIHPSNETRVNVNFLALAEIEIEFTGKSAHASASPEDGLNALDSIIATFNSISALRQHLPKGDKIHGIITSGGSAPNIIPEKASAKFYLRSLTNQGLKNVTKRFIDCVNGAAIATGTKSKIYKNPISYFPLKQNKTLCSVFRANLSQLGLNESIDLPPIKMGSSDIGNVSQVVPTIHPQIQMVDEEINAHTKEFASAAKSNSGKKVLFLGAKAMAMTALDISIDSSLLRKIKSEFKS